MAHSSPEKRKTVDSADSECEDKPNVMMLAMFAVAERMRSLNLNPVYTTLADNIVPPMLNSAEKMADPKSREEIVKEARSHGDLQKTQLDGHTYFISPSNPQTLIHESVLRKGDRLISDKKARTTSRQKHTAKFSVVTLPATKPPVDAEQVVVRTSPKKKAQDE